MATSARAVRTPRAVSALALLQLDPGTVGTDRAREIVFRIDPLLALVDFNPADQYPLSWSDWRPKGLVWTGMYNHPNTADVALLANDYLALPQTVVTGPPAPPPAPSGGRGARRPGW